MKPPYTYDLGVKTHEIPVHTNHHWPFLEETLEHKKQITVTRGVESELRECGELELNLFEFIADSRYLKINVNFQE